MDLSVKYDTLQLAQEMLDRQADQHLTNMKSFAQEWCHIPRGGGGAVGTLATKAAEAADGNAVGEIFQRFMPLNEDLAASGERSLDLLTRLHKESAEAMGDTIDTYAEADEAAYETFAKLLSVLGISVEPFSDPRDNPAQLGAADHSASSNYGGGDPFLFEQAAKEGSEAGEYDRYKKQRRRDQVARASSQDRSIQESQDASSFLVPPETPTSEMEDLRWSAGVILGSIDWMIEKITGKSLLNDVIYKYVVGDWKVVSRASIAWLEISDAAVAVGQNDSEILPALSEWTGKGSDAAISFITQLSENTTAFKDVAKFFSDAMKRFALVLKLAATGIGAALKFISELVLRLIAEGAIPVAGWIAAAADAAWHVSKVIGYIKLIYGIVNGIFDALNNFMETKAKADEIEYTLANMAEARVRREAATR